MMKRPNVQLATTTNISSSLTMNRKRNILKCSWKIIGGIGLGVIALQTMMGLLLYRSRNQDNNNSNSNQSMDLPSKSTRQSRNAVLAKGPPLPEKRILTAEERQRLVDMEQAVQTKIKEGDGGSQTVQSCRLHPELDCTNPSNHIVMYNPFDLERLVLCRSGAAQEHHPLQKIPPKDVVPMSQLSCKMMSTHLFSAIPSLETAKNLPPTVLLSSHSSRSTGSYDSFYEFHDCNIPCLYENEIGINTLRYVQGTPWSFMCSMEGPQYYHMLQYDKKAHLENNFFATTSYDSEVPLPYYSWAEYDIQKNPAVSFDNGIRGASFLARNCGSRNNREALVQELIELGFRVDSLSSCLHNAELPPGVGSLSDKKLVQAKYLFHLAFENQNENDYITEKLWGTLESGTLPIYFGAPNVKEHAPPNSVIPVLDFNTTKDLVEYLNQVMSNRTLYESYHAWRTLPLPASFHAKYDFTHIHSTCRMCRWAFAKQYGLRWNASTQSLASNIGFGRPTTSTSCRRRRSEMSRSLEETWWENPSQPGQVLEAGMIVPLSDYYLCGNENKKSGQQQSPHTPQFPQTAQAGGIQRTMWTYDGVLDILVESSNKNEAVIVQWLRYTAATVNAELVKNSQDPRRARFQDASIRWTILTSSDVAMTSPSPGIIDIPIAADHLPLRIRFIEEELDLIHEGGAEEEYYFGEKMINDFFHPVELFHVA